MKSLALVIAATLWILFQSSVYAQWTSSTSGNEMDGEVNYFAFSPETTSTRPMSSPYSNTRSNLAVGCSGDGDPWAYIWFSKDPNITNDETEDGYNKITTRVKIDDEEPYRVTLSQQWGSHILHFYRDNFMIDEFKRGSSLLLELSWYGQGTVYFRYSLIGSTAKISAAMAACTN